MMYRSLVAAVAATVVALASGASWLAVDLYASSDSCSADGAVQVSVLKQVGVCMDLPSGLPPPLNAAKSYKIGSCTNGNPYVAVEFDAYTKSGCQGIKIPYTVKDKIPSGCVNNTMISCQSSPVSQSELWPQVSLYLNDDKCSKAAGIVAARPGCSHYSGDNAYSMNVECPSSQEMHVQIYNATATCSGGILDQDVTIPAGECTLLGEIPIPVPPAAMNMGLIETVLFHPFGVEDVKDIVLTGYYKATC